MRVHIGVPHQSLEQRLGGCHAAAEIRLPRPDRAHAVDELLERWQSLAGHAVRLLRGIDDGADPVGIAPGPRRR